MQNLQELFTWICRHKFSFSNVSIIGGWQQSTSVGVSTGVIVASLSWSFLRRSSISFFNLIISSSLLTWLTLVTETSVLLFTTPKFGGLTFKTLVSFLINVVFFACLSSSNRLFSCRTSFSRRRHFSSNCVLSVASEVDCRLLATDILIWQKPPTIGCLRVTTSTVDKCCQSKEICQQSCEDRSIQYRLA